MLKTVADIQRTKKSRICKDQSWKTGGDPQLEHRREQQGRIEYQAAITVV